MGKDLEKVFLAMDTGFDGCKVCINGLAFNIPFSILDITGKEDSFMTDRTEENFIRSKINGKTYLLGERAKVSLLNKSMEKGQMDTFYTIGRFKTDEYKAALKSFIAYALYKYDQHCKEDKKSTFSLEKVNNGEVEIFLGIALPHKQKDEIWEESVFPTLQEPISLSLTSGEQEEIMFDFNLQKDNVCMNSQVISAMFAATMDENGNYLTEKVGLDYLPMLVIDAGYLTDGIFLFAENGQIVHAESNQDYAMYNVNERTAALCKENRPDVTSYNIETLANQNRPIRYSYEEDGVTKYAFYDIKEMRDAEIKRAAVGLNAYLEKTFNDLLDLKQIYVAGGTGEQYYEHLVPEYEKRMISSELIKPVMDGKEYNPVFAVVLGLYRSMKAIF